LPYSDLQKKGDAAQAYGAPVLLFSILENLRFTSRPDLAILKTFV
jgi:hypothetical protein